jgi:hypothetical protein
MTVGTANNIVAISNVDPQGNGASVLMQNGTGSAANILDGLVTAAGTLLTVPAGRTWVGTIQANGTVTTATGGAQAAATVSVATAGAGVIPAAGTYVQLSLVAPASAASSSGTAAAGEVDIQLQVVAPSANAVTLTVANSGMTAFAVSAIGNLL